MRALKVEASQRLTLNAFDRRVDDSGLTWSELDALADWLCRERWTHFVTITTRHELTGRGARRLMEKWMDNLGAVMPGIRCFWVAEQFGQKRKPGVHIHAVVQVPDCWVYSQTQKKFDPGQAWTGTNRRYWAWAIMVDAARTAAGGEKWRNNAGKVGRWHRVQVEEYRGEQAVKYCMKYLTKGFADWDYLTKLNPN